MPHLPQLVIAPDIGDWLLSKAQRLISSFTVQIAHLITVGSTRRVSCRPTIASLHEFLRPFVIHALCNAFAIAKAVNKEGA
jgi:hypothetical protein